jgi:hypothetical protein
MEREIIEKEKKGMIKRKKKCLLELYLPPELKEWRFL